MGKRPTSSTKAGRFMNPADQQRKVERRKELKRNRKQRQQVRSAVLKSKDCEDLIEQMKRMDEMEYDLYNKPPLPEKVIQTKREKLRETFLKVLGMYKRENENDKLTHARQLLQAYDAERNQMLQNFIAAKFAKESNPADIPLPGGFAMPGSELTPSIPPPGLVQIPLPGTFLPPHMLLPEPHLPAPASGILKKTAMSKRPSALPPGPPSGIPPELSDSDSDESSEDEERAGHVRFAGVRDDDEEKDTRTMYKQLAKKMAEEREEVELGEADPTDPLSSVTGSRAYGAFTGSAPSGPTYIRHVPPPPPGLPPRVQATISAPPSIRAGPVTGANRGPIGPRPSAPPPTSAAVISAEPTVNKKPTGPVIEAKPQLRNMQKEVVKLIPTAIRVRREITPGTSLLRKPTAPVPARTAPATGTKEPPQKSSDDAYDSFMKEISGIK